MRELIQQQEFARALTAAASLRAAAPEHRDLLYMIAVCQRFLKRVPDALSTLGELEKLHPQFSRLYQERGHCYVTQRKAGEAIEAFEHAVRLNASLPGSWHALAALYRLVGRPAAADSAAVQDRRLAALPAELIAAEGMFADGDLAESERIVREFLRTKNPLDANAMWLLAKIGMKLDIFDDAELLLEGVLSIEPDHPIARHDFAMVLALRHKHRRAMEEVEKLLETDPTNRAFRTTRAAILMGLGRHDEALPIYHQVLAETPTDPDLHLSVAHALKTMGKSEQAIASYRAAATLRPSYGEAYWSFANLKRYRFTDQEIGRMRVEESAPHISLADRYHFCFALGKALEDRGEYAESFRYYAHGNELKKSETRYKPASIEYNTRMLQKTFTNEFFDARGASGSPAPSPIFIVGLPRSGSTLIEQILSSHSKVEGTMELADIPRLVQTLQGRDNYDSYRKFWDQYFEALTARSPADLTRDGEQYITDTLIYRLDRKPFFTDKNPNNFRNIGLLQLILPNAKIMEDLGNYYRWYVEVMQHWDRVLPGKVLRVQHEEVVDDLETNVRRILDFCGLEFEPACLQFYNTERRVHTVSSEQVRRPVNRDGVDHWRHFEAWLDTLKTALGPLADLASAESAKASTVDLV
ncbi:MAG: sulfotransferase [Steroidobacteraceae bacterium]